MPGRPRRRHTRPFRRLRCERLEARDLLNADLGYQPGVTVITHGFQLDDNGDSLLPLAEAIRQETLGCLMDYDLPTEGGQGAFNTSCRDTLGEREVIVLWDWAIESNEGLDVLLDDASGWGEGAGDALIATLAAEGLVNLNVPSANLPFHFIGHSFGTAVTSEAVERLAALDIAVDQLTYLDPHDFDQDLLGVDTKQRLYDLGRPNVDDIGLDEGRNYGATVWNNVAFADVYYQTRGLNGSFVPDSVVPLGRPIPGAYNVFLNNGDELPVADPNPYSTFDGSGDHSYVWSQYYLASVTGTVPSGTLAPATTVDFEATGYAFSRVAGKSARPDPRLEFPPRPVGTSGEQRDFSHEVVQNASGDELDAFTFSQYAPLWDEREVFNGDFEHVGSNTTTKEITPGWSHHGGGGEGDIGACPTTSQPDNHCLMLSGGIVGLGGEEIRTHNRLYLPNNAESLEFDLRITDEDSDDELIVRLGDVEISRKAVTPESTEFVPQSIPIPANLRGTVSTLTFQIAADGVFNAIRANVDIDHVRFQAVDPEMFDFGDAPTSAQSGFAADYPTTLADNGARHQGGALFLGATIDLERDGHPDGGAGEGPAGGDDHDVLDDEDGVHFVTDIVSTATPTTASLAVVASQSGKIDAWIDFNHDGDWNDAGEQIVVSADVVGGTNLLPYNVPVDAQAGDTVLRVRLSSSGGLQPTGAAADGEVEDYLATILPASPDAPVDVNVRPPESGILDVVAADSDVVVRSGSVELFRAPGNALRRLELFGQGADDVLNLGNLSAIFAGEIAGDAGAGLDTLRLLDQDQTVDLPNLPDDRWQGLEAIDLRGTGSNQVMLDLHEVLNLSPTTDTLRLQHNEDDTIEFGSGWLPQPPQFAGGEYFHVLQQADASIEIVNTRAWHNPLVGQDANRDGLVTPNDVLVIINSLNATGARDLPPPTSEEELPPIYYDTTGDGVISPQDVLIVINLLNARASSGEGEPVAEQVTWIPLFLEEDRIDREDLWHKCRISDRRLLS